MKKNAFIQGAMIATLGIFISKMLGILYVIPFYAIIGVQGGALYSYGYSIYNLFLSFSTVGIPLAISKLTSEYDSLGNDYLKEKTFSLAKRLLFSFSFVCFLILIIFAPSIAYLFLGDIKGGNTIEDVTLIIRVVSFALLMVPLLSVTRGYVQGHKYIASSSFSQIIEQIVRVSIVLLGSYLTVVVLGLSIKVGVAVAVSGALFGGIVAYLYLQRKITFHKTAFKSNFLKPRALAKLTDKEIMIKVLTYSFPFVIIGLVNSLYNFVDLSTIVKTMVKELNYNVEEAESIIGILSTWGSKLNMIIIAVGMGLTTSLLPNITEHFVSKDDLKLKRTINKSLQVLLYVTIPMTLGLSFLTPLVWTVFYGYNELGITIFSYSVFMALFLVIMSTLNITFQALNEPKKMLTFLITGIMIKIIFNIPLMKAFHSYGFHAAYGAVTATILGLITASVLILITIQRKYKINYEETFNRLLDILLATFVMVFILLLLQFIIPLNTTNRLLAILLTGGYSLIGISIYLYLTIKGGVFDNIFGRGYFKYLLNKIRRWKND
ncbi:MAG: putative polysaccharide biosynthesis protein [Bacilli bacterium]|jgi:O-antigen/teichoic acid export membrane protein